mmetsp:Transcript_2221/g.3974  ORF Transcript_2221/g.3974 Transcript_2221/m.3974 type:complete len:159 (-) Transcript_2221:1418-1894(-)
MLRLVFILHHQASLANLVWSLASLGSQACNQVNILQSHTGPHIRSHQASRGNQACNQVKILQSHTCPPINQNCHQFQVSQQYTSIPRSHQASRGNQACNQVKILQSHTCPPINQNCHQFQVSQQNTSIPRLPQASHLALLNLLEAKSSLARMATASSR